MEIYKNLDINDLENEVWKVITDFPDYQISNYGRVKSTHKSEKILSEHDNGNGYLSVDLYRDGKRYRKYIHRLVYEIHNNYKLKKDEHIHHINENKKNNHIDNLEKMNRCEHDSYHNKGEKNQFYNIRRYGKDNGMFGIKRYGKNNPMFGRKQSIKTKKLISEKNRGENSGIAKLKEIEVIQIKMLLRLGFKNVEIAKKYNVDSRTISSIKLCKSWKYINNKGEFINV
jgi:hypothetical protein